MIMTKRGKTAGCLVALAVLVLAAILCYFKFFWIFSDGTKTGELNSLTYTGYLFKTYEGEMILTGYGAKNSYGTVQSKTFKFSVADREVAEQLTRMTGLRVTVHYKEYKGALPWRGYEKAVVDKVVADSSPAETPAVPADDPFFL